MRKKPTAYELEYTGGKNDVIKCECCSFKAVRAQFEETGSCPSCEEPLNIATGFNKSENRKKNGKKQKVM